MEMTEDDKQVCALRFSKKLIWMENDDTIWIKIDNPEGFVKQVLMAYANPNQAVVKKGDGE